MISVLVCGAMSLAAGRQAEPTGDTTRSVRVGGRTRSYVLHVPKGSAAGPRALVLVFHGGGSNPQGAIRLTGFSEKADREGFLVVYPAGSGRLPNVLTWNAGACCAYAASQNIDDVGFVRAVIDDVAAFTPVDRRRVFATGMSNGGQMSYRLGAELPDLIAAIAPVAGSLEVPADRVRVPKPVLIFHGSDDDHLPFAGGIGPRSVAGVSFNSVDRAVTAWTRVNGCGKTPTVVQLPDREDDGTTVERRTWPGCAGGADVVLYVIQGAGHTWPGRTLAERLLGVSTKEISATDLMWEFFKAHPMR